MAAAEQDANKKHREIKMAKISVAKDGTRKIKTKGKEGRKDESHKKKVYN